MATLALPAGVLHALDRRASDGCIQLSEVDALVVSGELDDQERGPSSTRSTRAGSS